MKTLRLSAAAALLALAGTTARATVRIVDNNVNAATPYSVIDSAIKASAPGDTVYVQASPTNYGTVNIDRRITLIGAGYAVTGTQFNLTSRVQNVYLDSNTVGVPVYGSAIIGLDINSDIKEAPNNISQGIKAISIERCRIGGDIAVSGNFWRIINCITKGIALSGTGTPRTAAHYAFISNNVIDGALAGAATPMSGIVIANNFFTGTGGSLFGVHNTLIQNNIFWQQNSSAVVSMASNSTFNNNITFKVTGSTTPTLPPTGNGGSNNMNNTNPQFVNVPLGTAFSYTDIPTYDFGFQTGSPAINAGSDGTNIGPSGGASPMRFFNGVPQLPQMQELNILNPVVNQNQPLNINFKARKMN